MISFQRVHLWLRLSLFSLFVVAFFGVLMRYKIGFEFPYFNQKNIQHGHSHFAFAGWITQTLMVLMMAFMERNLPTKNIKHYIPWLFGNLLCAYIMLVSFFVQGYGLFSITFSTISIFIYYRFAYLFLRDLNKISAHHPSKNWFKAGLWFGIISTLGTFALAYMMASKQVHQHLYLSSVYFYLHFQYNGWFFFACMGLFMASMHELKASMPQNKFIFSLFGVACLPAYFLSILWAFIPIWLYIIVIIASFAQAIAWILFIRMIMRNIFIFRINFSFISNIIFILIAFSVTIKLSLQLASTIPSISQLAFGFRPIVIAYLHLVFLAITSAFLVNYMFAYHYFKNSKPAIISMIVFIVGVFLNELALGIQGIGALYYILIPHINEVLFYISVFILLGCLMLFIFSKKEKSI